jgi:hypothetical protein
MLRRFGLLAVLGPCLGGCYTGMVNPQLAICSGAKVPATPDEVVATRVDVRLEQNLVTSARTEEHTATRIAVAHGKVAEQHALSLSYWWHHAAGDAPAGESRSRSVMVKLYRRGYQTVVIRAGESPPQLEWKPASTPDEQATAVRVFANLGQAPKAGPPARVTLAPGSAGDHHKQVLLLIAGEFERVAALYPAGSAGETACRKEAEDVRALAAR